MADGRPIPCVLVGNKCDQPASGPAANHDRLDAFARDKGFSGWFAASARDNINVEQAAEHLIKAIFESRHEIFTLPRNEKFHTIFLLLQGQAGGCRGN